MEDKFKEFQKELNSLLDTYVVNEKQKKAVEKYHMELVKKFFDNDITNENIKRINYYAKQIMPLINQIIDTDEKEDLLCSLGELVFQIEFITTLSN